MALCAPTGKLPCDLPCARQVLFLRWCGARVTSGPAGTVPQEHNLGMLCHGQFTGYRNETPASSECDATGILWHPVNGLQIDGQGRPGASIDFGMPSGPYQNEGIVVFERRACVGRLPPASQIPKSWQEGAETGKTMLGEGTSMTAASRPGKLNGWGPVQESDKACHGPPSGECENRHQAGQAKRTRGVGEGTSKDVSMSSAAREGGGSYMPGRREGKGQELGKVGGEYHRYTRVQERARGTFAWPRLRSAGGTRRRGGVPRGNRAEATEEESELPPRCDGEGV